MVDLKQSLESCSRFFETSFEESFRKRGRETLVESLVFQFLVDRRRGARLTVSRTVKWEEILSHPVINLNDVIFDFRGCHVHLRPRVFPPLR